MERKHASKFHPDPNLRSLQAQIDELWEVMEGCSTTLRQLLDNLYLANPKPLYNRTPPDGITVAEELVRLREAGGVLAEERLARLAAEEGHDAAAQDTVAEVAAELQPDAYEVKLLSHGWYQVVDSDGKPIHEGKLRKDKAQEVWRVAMEGA